MSSVMQVVLSALALGALYGSVGAGFVIVYRMSGMVNFAQGNIAVAGGFGAVAASKFLPPLLAVLAGALVAAAVSVLMYFLTIRPLRGQGLLTQTIVTLAVGTVIQSVLQLVFGTAPHQFDPITAGHSINVLGGHIPIESIWLIGLSVVAYLALAYFFDRTMIGKALTACAVNRYAAGVVGISFGAMAAVAFALAGAMAGGIESVQVPTSFISAGDGLVLGLNGFIAATLGGFNKLGATMTGGFLVALVAQAFSRYVSAGQATTVVFIALVLLLVLRPEGLTRKVAADRV